MAKGRYVAPLNSYSYAGAININCQVFKRLFNNNSYLLKSVGIRLRDQISDFSKDGIILNWGTIHNLKGGTNKTCSMTFVSYFSMYWGMSLEQLMFKDLSTYPYVIGEGLYTRLRSTTI